MLQQADVIAGELEKAHWYLLCHIYSVVYLRRNEREFAPTLLTEARWQRGKLVLVVQDRHYLWMAVFFKEPVRIFRKHSCHSERGATMVRRKSIMQKIAIDQCFYFPSYGTNVPSWLVSVLCCVSLSTRSNLMIGSALHNDMECQSLEKSVFCLSRTSLVWPIYRLRRDIFLAMVAPEL